MGPYQNIQNNEKQWVERLYYYTKRTRQLVYNNEDIAEYDASKINQIHKLFKGTSLFPSLRSLGLRLWPLSVAEADLLFPPGLREINLYDQYSVPRRTCLWKLTRKQQEQMCIYMLVRRCSALQIFHSSLSSYFSSSLSIQHLDPIFNLARLTTFCGSVHSSPIVGKRGEWLEKASRMRFLTAFTFSTINLSDDDVSQLDLGPFARLEDLHIMGNVGMLSSIFRSMRSPLRSVFIGIDLGDECSSMRDCLQSLVHNSGKQLTNFRLYPGRGDTSVPIFSLSFVLGPLTRIRTLNCLWIGVSCSISDHDITVFAKAWPYLRSIEIRQYPGLKADPSMVHAGFRALIELATRCPDLEYILLDLDLNNLPPFEEVPELKHNLGWLEIRPITSDDEEHLQNVATILHRIFPHMKTDFQPQYADVQWAKVLPLVKELQSSDNCSEPVSDA